MNKKSLIYFIIAILLVAGGSLLAVKGKDAVSKAESRKQAVLEVVPNTIANDTKPFYADFYIQESQIQKIKAGKRVKVHFPYIERSDEVEGVVASVASAPQFAALRMTREKGQADLSMYAVRITIDANAELLPGMTAEVDLDEIAD